MLFLCSILHIVVLEDTELSSVNITLTFSEGSTNTSSCVSIPIANDMVLEGDHAFTVSIISAGSSPHAIIGASSTATVTIEDDEGKSLLLCETNTFQV